MSGAAPRDWVGEYSQSHRHPVNRACHTIGIPMITVSFAVLVAGLFAPAPWRVRALLLAAAMFVVGWVFQFVGHYFEHKPPEFFRDPRFLFVGVRWWLMKMRGKA